MLNLLSPDHDEDDHVMGLIPLNYNMLLHLMNWIYIMMRSVLRIWTRPEHWVTSSEKERERTSENDGGYLSLSSNDGRTVLLWQQPDPLDKP